MVHRRGTAATGVVQTSVPPVQALRCYNPRNVISAGGFSMSSLRTCLVWIIFAAAALISAAPRCAKAQATGCGASPEVQAALDRLPQYRQNPAVNDWQTYVQRLGGIQALMREYPGNVFVQQAYIHSTRDLRGFDSASVEETRKADTVYKARYERNPHDARAAYLYGLTLAGHHTPQALKLFDAALKRDPHFELPHLELAQIYSAPNFRDKQQAAANLEAFIQACPESLSGYERLSGIGDKDLALKYAGKFRALLAHRTGAQALGAYRSLWTLEFKSTSPAQYSALRKRVENDAARIRELRLTGMRTWYETLEEGYKLAGDQKQVDWAQRQRETRFPESGPTPGMTTWLKDHQLKPGGSAAQKREHYEALLAETAKWMKHSDGVLCSLFIWNMRLGALSNLDDVPPTEVETAVTQMLKFAGANMSDGPWDSDYDAAASALAKKHVDPKRLVEFAQKGLAISELRSNMPASDLYFDKNQLANQELYEASMPERFLEYEVQGYLELKQAQNARLALQQLHERVQNLEAFIDGDQGRRSFYLTRNSAYWRLMARLAELDGHNEDAMAYYERALLDRMEAKQRLRPGEKDELALNAHALWSKLGGTEAGWNAWYGARAAQLASVQELTWKNANKPLPPFHLTDMNGKTWTAANLRGKVTLITFWASW